MTTYPRLRLAVLALFALLVFSLSALVGLALDGRDVADPSPANTEPCEGEEDGSLCAVAPLGECRGGTCFVLCHLDDGFACRSTPIDLSAGEPRLPCDVLCISDPKDPTHD